MTSTQSPVELDPVTISVLANRFDAIVREMSNTLLRSARSGVIAGARDFSCTIVTADNRLLTADQGIPVHIFGSHLQTASMCELHDDLAEGDAFLHNDPYLGNTHAADHTILIPVFVDGVHLFTTCAKSHQADTGNAVPTTYDAWAKDVYAEGALIFPCVRVQRDYVMNEDIVRMCRARIRVPDQWYGDFLATVGAGRTGERRLKDLCAKYGSETITAFIETWFDYSERRIAQAIKKLPKASTVAEGAHDPFEPILPDGIPVRVKLKIDPDEGMIEVDLRDNPDNYDCGLNQSEACAINNVVTGVFNCVDSDTPHNAGSFRRIRVLLRDGCVVGRPAFPHSCSMATTNLADRLISLTQTAFAKLGDGFGLAQGGACMSAVISGPDFRRGGEPFINQLGVNVNGGPAGPITDGWVTFGIPPAGGLVYRDSLELDEVKHPILFERQRLHPCTGGAGRRRGALGGEVIYGSRKDPLTLVIPSDGHHNPAQGAQGGRAGSPASHYRISANGHEEKLPNVVKFVLNPGEKVRFLNSGGGGYGNPLEREPERVLKDVRRGWETFDSAREVYGVVIAGRADDDTLAIDEPATATQRTALSAAAE